MAGGGLDDGGGPVDEREDEEFSHVDVGVLIDCWSAVLGVKVCLCLESTHLL